MQTQPESMPVRTWVSASGTGTQKAKLEDGVSEAQAQCKSNSGLVPGS